MVDQVRARTTTFAVAFDDVAVTTAGDAALVTGKNRITGAGGAVLDMRFTQVWIVEHGHWRRRAFQGTPIATPAKLPDMAEAEVRAASTALAEAVRQRDVAAAERLSCGVTSAVHAVVAAAIETASGSNGAAPAHPHQYDTFSKRTSCAGARLTAPTLSAAASPGASVTLGTCARV